MFYESVEKIFFHEIVNTSLIGIIIALISTNIPLLFYLKYLTGKLCNSRSLIADSKETLACAFLSITLLLGLGLNYFYGFWKLDPIIGLVIALFLVRDGFKTFKDD